MKPRRFLTSALAAGLVAAGFWMATRGGRESSAERLDKMQAGVSMSGTGGAAPRSLGSLEISGSNRQMPVTHEPTGGESPANRKPDAVFGINPGSSREAVEARSWMSRPAASSGEDTDPSRHTRSDHQAVLLPPPPGLRLAENVRLPAAAMPVEMKLTPVAEKVLKNILDDYYRDLAAGLAPVMEAVSNGGQVEGSPVETGEQGEKTVVVTNGEVAEYARKRADARFRAIFGYAAYNRITMQSALESRLPASGR